MKKYIPYVAAFILTAFALLTLFMSTSVLLDLFAIRAKEGNYVSFIVVTNFICSLLYLWAVYGFIQHKKWTAKLLLYAALFLLVAFIGLLFHIGSGGIYETKTVGAMAFRMSVTLIFSAIAFFTLNKK